LSDIPPKIIKNEEEIEVLESSAAPEPDMGSQVSSGVAEAEKGKIIAPIKVVLAAVVAALLIALLLINLAMIVASPGLGLTITLESWVVVGVLGFLLALSLGISFWMHFMRLVYLKNGPALVPERWGAVIADLAGITKKTNKQTLETLDKVASATNTQREKADSLLESFLTLQQALTLRDEEISRLKKGYDSKIFSRFIKRFVRVSQALSEIHAESKGGLEEKNYKYLVRLLDDALEECGIEKYAVTVGDDFRELGSEVADSPTIVETEDAKMDYQIATTEKMGYRISGGIDKQIVVSAKVSIYRLSSNTEPESN